MHQHRVQCGPGFAECDLPCSVAAGRRSRTANLRERVTTALGEAPGQGVVYRQGGLVIGRKLLHQGTRPGDGLQTEGPGGTREGFFQLHDPGVPGPEEHETRGPGAGGGGAGRSGQVGRRFDKPAQGVPKGSPATDAPILRVRPGHLRLGGSQRREILVEFTLKPSAPGTSLPSGTGRGCSC